MLTRLLSLSDVSVIAHRGGSKLRPENTVAAFDHAVALGVDACECDVHLSRDGEVVVIHDPSLDRTTDASGLVRERTASELSRVDAGYRFGTPDAFPFRGAGLGVPRLADLLSRYQGLPWIVEIKGTQPETAARTIAVVRAARAADRVIIGGFSRVVFDAVRRTAPEIVTSASSPEVRSALRWSHLRISPRRTGYRLFQVPFRLRGRRIFGRTFVRVARQAGFPVQAWIIDEPADMTRLIGWGVTGLTSDRPDLAMEAVRLGSVAGPESK